MNKTRKKLHILITSVTLALFISSVLASTEFVTDIDLNGIENIPIMTIRTASATSEGDSDTGESDQGEGDGDQEGDSGGGNGDQGEDQDDPQSESTETTDTSESDPESTEPAESEICGNSQDDDGDGSIDEDCTIRTSPMLAPTYKGFSGELPLPSEVQPRDDLIVTTPAPDKLADPIKSNLPDDVVVTTPEPNSEPPLPSEAQPRDDLILTTPAPNTPPKPSKGGDYINSPDGSGPNTIDPGTNTIPGPPYSDEDEAGEKCGFAGPFPYCLEPADENPGAPIFRQGEICRNGLDDNGNGRVDEEPYCAVTSESAPKCSTEGRTEYFIPKDPKARTVKIPPCEITLTPEESKGPSPFGP